MSHFLVMKIVIKSSIILPLKHLHLPESLELPLPVHRLANWNVTRRSLIKRLSWICIPAQQLTDKIYKSLWNPITWHTYLQSISSTACPSSGITPISISIVYKINFQVPKDAVVGFIQSTIFWTIDIDLTQLNSN